ncbi:hypothetical protein ACFQ6C_26110 [Streptomyces sp. NPDC056454]|uniref:hypothetical protein n=1 Tax=Streptomyces sp. NPDC056454 TaxID=3345823 RepID=UPI003693F67A
MDIEPGQIYRSLDPRDELYGDGPRRIKVVGQPVVDPGQHNFGKVQIATLTQDGREIRRRQVNITQLHAKPVGKNGSARRSGYLLEK